MFLFEIPAFVPTVTTGICREVSLNTAGVVTINTPENKPCSSPTSVGAGKAQVWPTNLRDGLRTISEPWNELAYVERRHHQSQNVCPEKSLMSGGLNKNIRRFHTYKCWNTGSTRSFSFPSSHDSICGHHPFFPIVSDWPAWRAVCNGLLQPRRNEMCTL